MIKITELISDEMCHQAIRKIRWENGKVCCPKCKSVHTKKNGHDDVHTARQQYQCKACRCFFDDLTDTVFSGHHQPLKVWVACLYLMGLNVSNSQVAKELDLNTSDVHYMTSTLRSGVVEHKPEITLEGEVEFDEVYIVAGHKAVFHHPYQE